MGRTARRLTIALFAVLVNSGVALAQERICGESHLVWEKDGNRDDLYVHTDGEVVLSRRLGSTVTRAVVKATPAEMRAVHAGVIEARAAHSHRMDARRARGEPNTGLPPPPFVKSGDLRLVVSWDRGFGKLQSSREALDPANGGVKLLRALEALLGRVAPLAKETTESPFQRIRLQLDEAGLARWVEVSPTGEVHVSVEARDARELDGKKRTRFEGKITEAERVAIAREFVGAEPYLNEFWDFHSKDDRTFHLNWDRPGNGELAYGAYPNACLASLLHALEAVLVRVAAGRETAEVVAHNQYLSRAETVSLTTRTPGWEHGGGNEVVGELRETVAVTPEGDVRVDTDTRRKAASSVLRRYAGKATAAELARLKTALAKAKLARRALRPDDGARLDLVWRESARAGRVSGDDASFERDGLSDVTSALRAIATRIRCEVTPTENEYSEGTIAPFPRDEEEPTSEEKVTSPIAGARATGKPTRSETTGIIGGLDAPK